MQNMVDNPLVMAYMGDTIYEQYVREYLIKNGIELVIDSKFNRQRKAKDNTIIQHFCNGITFRYIIPTLYKVKPWQVEKVRNVLKIHIYDDLLDEYQQRIKEINTKKEAN